MKILKHTNFMENNTNSYYQNKLDLLTMTQ